MVTATMNQPKPKQMRLEGVLNINKPAGMTSHDVVDAIRGVIKNRKIRVGHTGTLDPMATGVLPLCIGRATKIVQFLIAEDKEYLVDMQLGIVTNSQDTTGEIVEEKPVPELNQEQVSEILDRFLGEQEQIPPMISAKHHQGKRLYVLARQGVEVERKPCKIFIQDIHLEAIDLPNVRFRVTCSKGTYIRTLCHDIGLAMNSGAAMCGLVRTRCGAFSIGDATDLETLRTSEDIAERLTASSDALSTLPLIVVGPEGKAAVSCGRNVSGGQIRRRNGDFPTGAFIRIAERNGSLMGVGEALMASNQLDALAGNLSVIKPIKVFAN